MFIKFSLLLLLTSPMLQAHDQSLAVRCFQCSEFPSEPEDQDEPMGPCPGWLRPPVIFPAVSVYDGCMTILLSNGSIVAQSGVVYDTCLELQGEAPDYVNETFGMPGLVKCCKGRQCGHGAVYLDTWPPVTQVYDIYGGKGIVVLNDVGQVIEKNQPDDLGGGIKQAVVRPPPCKYSSSFKITSNYYTLISIFTLIFLSKLQ